MNSKTNKLWLPLILVIALVLTFGLVMAYAPTAQSANADIGDQVNVPWEGVMNSYIYVSEIDSENVYVRIRENYEWVESGNPKDPLMHPYYDFSAEGYNCQTANEKFQYSISTPAQDFVNHLWTIEINSSSDFTGDNYLEDENFDLKAYYASYDVMQDRPDVYANPDLAISNYWCVVLCDGDDSNPIAYATIYLFDCPFVWKDATMTFGEVTGEIIMNALHDTGDNAYAQLKGDASGNRLCGYLYQKGDNYEQYARMGYDWKYSSTPHDKSELLPVGTYIIDMYWISDPNYADGEAYIQFEVLPKVINATYSYSDVVRTYGDESLPAPDDLRNYDEYLMEYTDPVDYAKIVWYYEDGSEDGAPLPTGLDLYPGNYFVWPQLVEYKYEYGWWVVDNEAHNCELGTISWNGNALSKEGNHGTLTIEAIDISTALAAASFTGLTYGDAASFAFRTNANTALTTALADATSNWGDVDIEIDWYYVLKVEGVYDFDTHYPFNEWVSAGTYAVRYEIAGERAAGVTGALTKTGEGGFFDDEAPIRLTIAKKAIDDVTVYLGTEEKNGELSMYTGSTPVANTLYYSPMGLQFFVKSMSSPEVKFVFDGWKKNANDDEETPTLDISEQIGKTYYVYNIHAVKNVDGEWVEDDNYNITLRNCQVTIEKRIIYISPNMEYLFYNGEEQTPEFDILGTDLYLNPNETAPTEFEIGENKWIILERQQNNLNLGTNAGSDYVYGVQVRDDSKYAIAWMPDGSDLHTSYSWNYEILKADPTLTLTEKEDWYHYEEVPGDAYDEMLEYLLTYKFTFDYETAQESDVIEISYISWSDDGVYWYTLGAADAITLANSVSLGKGNTLRFQVMTAGTDNYAPSHVDIDFEIQSAPIYLIYDEEDVTFGAPESSAYFVEWSDFGVEMYRKGSGIDPRERDNTYFPGTPGFYINSLVSFVEGKNDTSSIYCGEHVFELKLNNEEKGYLANGEVHWTIAWTEITVEDFNLPSGFVYGGDNGTSYYQTPYIDYRASSRPEAYVPTYDTYFQMGKTYYTEAAGVYTPAEVTVGEEVPADTYYEYQYSEIIGKATGFGTIPDSYKWPVEVWEFTTNDVGEDPSLYEGEWTTWDEFNYPKNVGTYYVRYSAKFYNASSYADTEYVDGWGYKTVVSAELLARGSAAIGYQYGSFTIVPKEITLTWNGLNYEYDGDSHQATITATLAYGENVADQISYTDTYYKNYQEGGYALTATNNNANYTIANPNATLNIGKVKIEIVASDLSLPYGSEYPELDIDSFDDKLVAGESEAALREAEALTGAPVLSVNYERYKSGAGAYEITCDLGTLWALNYEFALLAEGNSNGTLTIYKSNANAALSITQTSTVIYDGNALSAEEAVEYDYATFSGDKEDIVFKYSKTASDYVAAFPTWTDADTYTVYFEATSANYETVTGSFAFEISKATSLGTIAQTEGKTLTYNGGDLGGSSALTDTIATVADRDKASIAKTYKTTEDGVYGSSIPTFSTAGTHTVWYKVTADNHEDSEGVYVITIEKLAVGYDFKIDGNTVTVYTIENDGITHTVSAVPTGFVGGDDLSISVTGETSESDSDTYTVTLTLVGAAADNYKFANGTNSVEVQWSIGQGVITVATPIAQTGAKPVYDGANTVVASVDTTGVSASNGNPVTVYYSKTLIAEDAAGWSTSVPQFTTAGTFNVYYKITATDCNTIGATEDAKFTVTVDKKTLYVNWNVVSNGDAKVYGPYTYFQLTYNGDFQAPAAELTGVVGSDAVALTFDATKKSKNVVITDELEDTLKEYVITGITADGGNYVLADDAVKTHYFRIVKAPLTITLAADATYYGNAPSAITASIAEGEAYYDDVANIYEIVCGVDNTTVAGAYPITIDWTGKSRAYNYDINFTKGTYTVNARPITVRIDNKVGTYGDEPATLTANVYSAFATAIVNGDTDVYQLNCVVTKTTGVGEYAITGDYVGEMAKKYAIAWENAIYTVNTRAITIVYKNEEPVSVTYASADWADIGDPYDYLAAKVEVNSELVNFSLVNEEFSDIVEISFKLGTTSVAISELGTTTVIGKYVMVVADAQGQNPNYVITLAVNTDDNAYLQVTPAKMQNVTVEQDGTLTYTGSELTASLHTIATVANNDHVTFEYKMKDADGEYGAMPPFTNAGTYTVLYKITSDNYETEEGEFEVTVGGATFVSYSVAQTNAEYYVYSASEMDLDGYYVERYESVNKQEATFAYKLEGADGEYGAMPTFTNAGSYTVLYEITAPNHVKGTGSFTVVVKKAPLQVAADYLTVTYGDEAPEYTYTFVGFLGEDDEDTAITITEDISFFSDYDQWDNAGTYDIYKNAGEIDSDNYEIEYVGNSLRVNKAALTITADDKTITYGDQAPTYTVSYDGFLRAEDTVENQIIGEQTYTILTSADNGNAITVDDYTNVGNYVIHPNFVDSINYDITFENGTLTVQKKNVTITATDVSITYGDVQPAVQIVVKGAVHDQEVFLYSYECDGVKAGANAATYPITITVAKESEAWQVKNYVITATDGTYVIKKATPAINTDDIVTEYYYTAKDIAMEGEATTVGGAISYEGTTFKKVGTYTVTVNVAESTNYTANSTTVTVTVHEAKVEPKVDEATGTIDASTYKDVDEETVKTEGVSIKESISSVVDVEGATVAELTLYIGERTKDDAGNDTSKTTITFDLEALKKLAENENVKIVYNETKLEDIDPEDVLYKNAQLVLQVSLGGASFEGGTATITTDFENLAPKGKEAAVFYLDEVTGQKTRMSACFANGKVTFTAPHFSTYVVEYVDKDEGLGGGAIAGIVIGCVAAVVLGYFCFRFLKKKKAAKANEAAATEAPAEEEKKDE